MAESLAQRLSRFGTSGHVKVGTKSEAKAADPHRCTAEAVVVERQAESATKLADR